MFFRACGATIVNRTDELREEDVGTRCGLFEVRKIGDEYYIYIVNCKDPKACTIVLRGASKDILNEVRGVAWLPLNCIVDWVDCVVLFRWTATCKMPCRC